MSQQKAKPPEYETELKLAAVRRVLAGESVSAVAQELGIRRKRQYVWKDRNAELGEAGLMHRRGGRPRKPAVVATRAEAAAGRGQLLAARKRVAELERKSGREAICTLIAERAEQGGLSCCAAKQCNYTPNPAFLVLGYPEYK